MTVTADRPLPSNVLPPTVPVLVGITGKRDLQGQDDEVRRSLETAFGLLDKELPNAPKVLLSGLAIGADTIAADLALSCPKWLVAAILPMTRELYLEDFPAELPGRCTGDGSGKPGLSARRTIEGLLGHPKVKVVSLTHLRDEATGKPYEAERLANREGMPNPLRSAHYEQLGLWLAETATLLIAVMPVDEAPDRLGGTARVVDYRLNGRPDREACDVLRASFELCESKPLDQGRLGPLWLIDAPVASTRRTTAPEPFAVSLADPRQDLAYRRRRFTEQLRASLALARAFDGLASRLRVAAEPTNWPVPPPDPVATLVRLRRAITIIQSKRKLWLTRSTYALAVLFCAAVLSFDLYIERGAHGLWAVWTLIAYFAAVLIAGTVHFFVDWRRWQRIAEDYRAVNEALRVQLAWWQAGLSAPEHRVDRHYLTAVHGPILYTRHAVRAIVNWTRLCCLPNRPASDWSGVYGPGGDTWVTGQIAYFRRHARQRKHYLDVVHIASWVTFLVALFLALLLFGYVEAPEFVGPHAARLLQKVRFPLGLIMLGAGLWGLIRQRRSGTGSLHWRLAATLVSAGIAITLVPVLPAAASSPDSRLRGIAAMLVVLFSAIAGAIRFVGDKLAWEAEANRYEDALAVFERGAAEFAAIDLGVEAGRVSPDAAVERKQQIGLALGLQALGENEYWLRAHRERPIEQAIGG